MSGIENSQSEPQLSEQQATELTIAELDEQIARMTDYVEKHSESASGAIFNTLKATMRYRASLALSLGTK